VAKPSSKDAKRRQLRGSRRGSAAVQREFARAITRRRFCELVGIHQTTLEKWERRGIVVPRLETILNSPTRVFNERDVEFGRRLIVLLRERQGMLSLEEAARLARRQRDP
jgi:DNA-binding transcriptional MerR regulator